jgi:hypothetical protein
MSFTIEVFPDEPILLVTFHSDLDMGSELSEIVEQCNAVLDAAPEPLYFVSDVLAYTFAVN